MSVNRRTFLKGTLAAGALTLARPFPALGDTLAPSSLFSTSRTSRLFPGTTLVHCDMHNHTLLSDGNGDPERAFGSMRDAGLDVAALTDHATIQWGSPVDPCLDQCAGTEASDLAGIDQAKWARLGQLADAANAPGAFLAVRGFEWSSPSMGHMNVWYSQKWIDPLHTPGGTTGEGAPGFLAEEGAPMRPGIVRQYNNLMRTSKVAGLSMAPFYNWLKLDPATPVVGGGSDGLASFNHPGREPGRFGHFKYSKALADRVVAMEVFNRRDDYLYMGTEYGEMSPLNECLNRGWRVGLSGVTDEHGTDWGFPEGKGRMGLWVDVHTRDGVRDALLARRFFATRLAGLRVDASAKGVRMGSRLRHTSGPIEFRVDIDRGPEWYGKLLNVQVLRPGTSMPTILHAQDVRVPTASEPVIKVWVDNVDLADGGWVVLRVTDPSQGADGRADSTFAQFGNAVAYASPWFLQA